MNQAPSSAPPSLEPRPSEVRKQRRRSANPRQGKGGVQTQLAPRKAWLDPTVLKTTTWVQRPSALNANSQMQKLSLRETEKRERLQLHS